jgi:hypothetical protein
MTGSLRKPSLDLGKYGKQDTFLLLFLAIILAAGVLSAGNKCSIINNVEREIMILPAGNRVLWRSGRENCDKKELAEALS